MSIRDLAAEVGITPGALYHYFPTKQNLLVATVAAAHTTTPRTAMQQLLSTEGSPEDRLFRFVHRLCERFAEDPDFLHLLERAMLNRDPEVRKALSDTVFGKNIKAMDDFLEEFASGWDKHMLSISVYGLIVHHYKTAMVRRELLGYDPQQDEPEYVARHIMKLLQGIFGSAS